MTKFAILIDAGFAKPKLGSRDNPATARDFQGLVDKICADELFLDKDLYRVYFYDAPPFSRKKQRPLGGGLHDFGTGAPDIAALSKEEDLRALTPLIYAHINPYGIFELDMNERLPLKVA